MKIGVSKVELILYLLGYNRIPFIYVLAGFLSN